ncbi:ABC transporter permease [Streptomyces sp. NPDC059999]|uniref:ABC transporter permease n=1 Tax=Streptomyces sp. NPDC059999 TaxID=3347030 RepID=UPI0036CDBF54
MLKTALRNALAHKARLLLTVLAVCLGVAFVSGTLVFADSSAAAHRAAVSKSFANIAVTVTPRQPPPGAAPAGPGDDTTVVDDVLARKLADVPGVAAVRPSADGPATLNGSDGAPLRAGRTWANLGAAYVPGADGKDGRFPLVKGHAPRNDAEIAVDDGTAAAGGFALGDTITLATDGPVLRKRLVGVVTTKEPRVTAGGTLTLFHKATAQALFASPGHYTSIDLTAAPGTGQLELAERVLAMLPADRAEATTGTAQADQQGILVNTLTRGYTKLPLVFAGVSLFIGSFLIVNTFTMLVSRRGREIALLRAIGASRRQVVRSVLWEAALVGLAASALGFLLGLGIAAVLPDLLSSGDALPRGPWSSDRARSSPRSASAWASPSSPRGCRPAGPRGSRPSRRCVRRTNRPPRRRPGSAGWREYSCWRSAPGCWCRSPGRRTPPRRTCGTPCSGAPSSWSP